VRESIEEISDKLGPMDINFEKKLDDIKHTSPLSPDEFKQETPSSPQLQR
jgi:hypothetical protein